MTLEEIEFFFVTPTFAIKQNWNKIVPLFSLCPVRSNCANNGQQLANISINFDLSIRLNLQMRTHNSMEILDKENDIQISHRTCYLLFVSTVSKDSHHIVVTYLYLYSLL